MIEYGPPSPTPAPPPVYASGVVPSAPGDPQEFAAVAQQYPGEYDVARAYLAGLDQPPDDPRAWLGELCKRIAAGSPAPAAAMRIPLNFRAKSDAH